MLAFHPSQRPSVREEVSKELLLSSAQGFLQFGFVIVGKRCLEGFASSSLELFKNFVRRSSPDKDEEHRTPRMHSFSQILHKLVVEAYIGEDPGYCPCGGAHSKSEKGIQKNQTNQGSWIWRSR